jgi:cysteine-rich repeat protein
MSKRLWFLALFSALVLSAPVWLSGAAQAGPTAVCGDGNIEGDEECDDSNTVTGDGCSHPSCLPEVCGDTITNPDPPSNESCDDGNTVSGDGCDENCVTECGNGNVDTGEDCDTSGESATCDDDCTNVACGDTNTNEAANEQCDDGNTVAGDGCNATCQDEGPVEGQTKKQQACINAVNKNLAGVVKAQAADNSACFKAVAGGKDTVAVCYGNDVKGKVAKGQAKTTATVTGKKCTGEGLPTAVVIPVAATINDAGEVQTVEGTTAVFGNPPVIAAKATDKDAAACQAEVAKQYAAIVNKWIQEANKAKKTALKGGKGGTPAPVATAAELGTAIDTALTGNANVGKAVTKSNTGIGKKCPDTVVDANVDCGGATTSTALQTCVATAAQQAACEAFEAADVLTLTCLALPVP